jgi:hypothetical protein
MLRKFIIYSMSLSLVWTTLACGSPEINQSSSSSANQTEMPTAFENRLSDGQYPVQQATYDDANGEYSVMLLNTKPSDSSVFRTTSLAMARLTNEEVAAGKTSYLKVENQQPSLHLTENFKIEYVHNVTENRTDPQTGRTEPVVIRQEPSFWSPFAGALAGQALGSLLFRPHYYVPPVYQPGVPLTGFGGYGSTYGQAVQQYQTRYNAPPAEVRNRQVFRTTGRLRSPSYGYNQPRSGIERDRSTGSGYGTSTLRRSNGYGSTYRQPGSSFGSSRRSFGSVRRR